MNQGRVVPCIFVVNHVCVQLHFMLSNYFLQPEIQFEEVQSQDIEVVEKEEVRMSWQLCLYQSHMHYQLHGIYEHPHRQQWTTAQDQ